jgi:hypothetical protein
MQLMRNELNTAGDVDYEFFPTWETRKVYVCPRGVAVHRNRPESCGAACHKALAGGRADFEDAARMKLFTVRKSVTFNEDVCKPSV